jgi:hypothetical protein
MTLLVACAPCRQILCLVTVRRAGKAGKHASLGFASSQRMRELREIPHENRYNLGRIPSKD